MLHANMFHCPDGNKNALPVSLRVKSGQFWVSCCKEHLGKSTWGHSQTGSYLAQFEAVFFGTFFASSANRC